MVKNIYTENEFCSIDPTTYRNIPDNRAPANGNAQQTVNQVSGRDTLRARNLELIERKNSFCCQKSVSPRRTTFLKTVHVIEHLQNNVVR